MAIIDFKEIPQANTANGEQDTFELFARDFVVQVLGLKIISQPNRGADGGKDFLAEETKKGPLGDTYVLWLVSCKHFAHSGKSVSETDESNILDRVHQHNAKGFIGFYSTIPSSGLGNRLDALKKDCNTEIFDYRRIEHFLIEKRCKTLLERYFPTSFSAWKKQEKSPSILLDEYKPLNCAICGKDLLQLDTHGLIVFSNDKATGKTHDVVGVCRGECDHRYSYIQDRRGFSTSWEDIDDFSIPTVYLEKIMVTIKE